MRAAVNVGALLLAGLVSVGGAWAAASGGRLFCCNEESGRQICGDILPQACYGRAYREIGESGMVIRRVEAPLTPEQRAQKEVEDRKRREEEAAQREQRRKDMALLSTYSSLQDIDLMRARNEVETKQAIKDAEQKIVEIRQRRRKFEDEAEFYKKRTLPPEVDKGLRDTDAEIKAQEQIIEGKRKDLDIARTRFEDDRRRYLDLMRRNAAAR